MVNQKTISKLANVSVATVSRVLNDDPSISKKTKERVRKVIQETGYIPNTTARNLRTSKTKSIGMIVPDLNNPYFVNLVTECQRFFINRDYNFYFCNSNEDRELEGKAISGFLQYKVAGIIASFIDGTTPFIHKIKDMNIPTILVERDKPEETVRYDCVKINNEGSIVQIVDYLYSLDHRKIAILLGPKDITPGYERYNGYLRSMQSHGLSINHSYVVWDTFSNDKSYYATQMLLSHPDRPTAIIATSSMTTIGAYKALVDSDIPIPQEISLIGLDDFPLASYVSPPITLISRPIEDIGHLICTMLEERMENGYGEDSPARNILIPTKLVLRGSCAPPQRKVNLIVP